MPALPFMTRDKARPAPAAARRAAGPCRVLAIGVALAAAAVGAGLVRAAPPPEAEWQRLPQGPDRVLHAMVYDEANDSFWSFGGVEADPGSNKFHNTVYRLDAGDPEARWALVPIGGLRPPPTAFHSAVYDPVRERMLVYGGLVDRRGTTDQRPADPRSVWALELADPDAPTWTSISFTGGVGDRFAHAAAYLPAYDAMVVTGGASAFDRARGDGFALVLSEDPPRHVRLANAGFALRAGHVLLAHEGCGCLLAYGGTSSLAAFDTYGDIVTLDVSAGLDGADRWTRMTTATPGTRRALMAAAYDPERQLWWVHGGVQTNTAFLRELSVLSLGGGGAPEWTRTTLVYNGPLDRFGHVAAWDTARGRAVFQGGGPDNASTLPDTRALAFAAPIPTAAATGGSTAEPATPTATGTDVGLPTASPASVTPSVTARTTAAATATVRSTSTSTAPSDATAVGEGHRVYLPDCHGGSP